MSAAEPRSGAEIGFLWDAMSSAQEEAERLSGDYSRIVKRTEELDSRLAHFERLLLEAAAREKALKTEIETLNAAAAEKDELVKKAAGLLQAHAAMAERAEKLAALLDSEKERVALMEAERAGLEKYAKGEEARVAALEERFRAIAAIEPLAKVLDAAARGAEVPVSPEEILTRLTSADSETARLSSALEARSKEASELGEKIAALAAGKEALEKQLKLTAERAAELESELTALKASAGRAQRATQEAADAADRVDRAAHDKLLDRLAAAEAETGRLSAQLEARLKEASSLAAEMTGLKAGKEALEKELSLARERAQVLERELTALKTSAAGPARETPETADDAVERVDRASHDKILARLTAAEAETRRLSADLEASLKEASSLAAEMTGLKAVKEALEKQLILAAEQAAALQRELAVAKSAGGAEQGPGKAPAGLDDAEKKMAAVQAELMELRGREEELRKKDFGREAELTALRSQLAEAQVQIDQEKRDFEEAANTVFDLQGETAALSSSLEEALAREKALAARLTEGRSPADAQGAAALAGKLGADLGRISDALALFSGRLPDPARAELAPLLKELASAAALVKSWRAGGDGSGAPPPPTPPKPS